MSEPDDVVPAVCAVVENVDEAVLAVYDRGWDARVPPTGRVEPSSS